MDIVVIVLTFLRLLVPLLIFKSPLLGIALSIAADVSDYNYYPFKLDEDYKFYQIWDKLLDTYYLAIASYTSLFWKDMVARRVSIVSFIYRVIGMVLSTISTHRAFLFLFPNFFENFFIFYLLFVKITGSELLITSKKVLGVIILMLLIPKLLLEYFVHVLEKIPAESINIPLDVEILRILQVVLYLLPQGLLLAYLVSKSLKAKKVEIEI